MKAVKHWFSYEPQLREDTHKKMMDFLQQIQTRIRPLETFPLEFFIYQVLFSACGVNKDNDGLSIHVYEPRSNWQRSFELK